MCAAAILYRADTAMPYMRVHTGGRHKKRDEDHAILFRPPGMSAPMTRSQIIHGQVGDMGTLETVLLRLAWLAFLLHELENPCFRNPFSVR